MGSSDELPRRRLSRKLILPGQAMRERQYQCDCDSAHRRSLVRLPILELIRKQTGPAIGFSLGRSGAFLLTCTAPAARRDQGFGSKTFPSQAARMAAGKSSITRDKKT